MDAFGGLDNFWDLSQHPSTFSTLPEDDFLALLQKQFPTTGPFDLSAPDGIDPININPLPIHPTPPSTDSSPSPPSTTQETMRSRRHSGVFSTSFGDHDDPTLKRKASDDSMSEEPTHKTAHTDKRSSSANGSNRRKSTGNPQQDESRIMKRKEQNRAAQRAFRERKEKHVKDLEDKVAALEAKNSAAESENGNLRDLLSRLQSENMALKQAAFTFTVPKPNSAPPSAFQQSSQSFFTPGASTSTQPQPQPQQQQQQQASASGFDVNFGTLIPFDPASLNMLDEPAQSADAMNLDYSFGQPGASPYKTIASNPMYMSFAEPSPYDLAPSPMTGFVPSPPSSGADSQTTGLTPFDWNSPTTSSPPTAGVEFDQLFGGFNAAQSPVDFSALLRSSPSSVSPVSHAGLRSASTSGSSASNSPESSHSLSGSPVSHVSSNTSYNGSTTGGDSGCPKSREECAAKIAAAGASPFVQAPLSSQPPQNSSFFAAANNDAMKSLPTGLNGGAINGGDACPKITRETLLAQIKSGAEDSVGPHGGFVRKTSDGNNSMIMCKGSSFPKTEKNERNIEVLTAWRSIMQNPQFKNVDINELCSEFTKKARCDGTKVVLEPEGVTDILETLSTKRT
ncbi:bZIP transcription factor [Phanerochaete sordida]|uniref:BZIP transcription factor n=1 Tax=Phanerochaete sordida TaxID=48140 RepID=A0A9P3LH07_9APHY|nr:bZIP transcription factor [Phanerochaete sordida]